MSEKPEASGKVEGRETESERESEGQRGRDKESNNDGNT